MAELVRSYATVGQESQPFEQSDWLRCAARNSSSPSIQMKSINMSSLSAGFITWIHPSLTHRWLDSGCHFECRLLARRRYCRSVSWRTL